MPQTCRKYRANFQIIDVYRRAKLKRNDMAIGKMKLSSRALGRIAALAIAGVSLTGCVVYPSGGYAYSPGYYAPGYAYAPPVGVVVGGGWWGGGWGHGGWGHGGWR
jgi:hypothetical protein